MSDIPGDIVNAARKVVIDDLGMDSPGLLQTSYIDCIAEAILTERERSRQLLSEADKRERETLTQLSELAETAASDLVEKWKSDLGATADTKAAGVASHIVNDFRGHIEAALIKLERRAALERSEG